jgi:hypothetical protein
LATGCTGNLTIFLLPQIYNSYFTNANKKPAIFRQQAHGTFSVSSIGRAFLGKMLKLKLSMKKLQVNFKKAHSPQNAL